MTAPIQSRSSVAPHVSRVRDLYGKGVPIADIAAEIGVKLSTLYRYIDRAGWIRPKPASRPGTRKSPSHRAGNVPGCKTHHPDLKLFAANFDRLRRNANLSSLAVAQSLGLDASTPCKWISGEAAPNLHALRPLAKALGCKVSDLLAGFDS